MTVRDYQVTTPYGKVAGYPLNNGFHRGIDYGAPMNTPLEVNGQVIGFSGSTGASTGPHCHVGKWSGSNVFDPGVGNGFSFSHAEVSAVGYDAVNGNYIKLLADGYTWIYCHLNKVNVTVGQVIGDAMTIEDKAWISEELNKRDKRLDAQQKDITHILEAVDELNKNMTKLVKPGGRLDTDYSNLSKAIKGK